MVIARILNIYIIFFYSYIRITFFYFKSSFVRTSILFYIIVKLWCCFIFYFYFSLFLSWRTALWRTMGGALGVRWFFFSGLISLFFTFESWQTAVWRTMEVHWECDSLHVSRPLGIPEVWGQKKNSALRPHTLIA